MRLSINDKVGTKRQKLTATQFLRRKGSQQIWRFDCDCGGFKIGQWGNFTASNSNNCGCRHGLQKHEKNYTDRSLRKGAYNSWVNMRARCNNKNLPDYKYYGGRGIKICKEWDDFNQFISDMGEPDKAMTLDRVDVNGDYSPSNCVWASRFTQANNRRVVRQVTYKGKTAPLGAWAKQLDIKISEKELYKRIFIRGWSVQRAFEQPPRIIRQRSH